MQVNGKTYVPAKAAIEALGGTFSSTKAGKVTLKLNNKTIVAAGNSKAIKVNGSSKTLGASPFVTKDGVLMIPSTMMSDYFGYKVSWNSRNKSLTITEIKANSGKSDTGKTASGKTDTGKYDLSKTDSGTTDTEKTASGETNAENSDNVKKEDTPWTGVWTSTYGTLLLIQNNTKVTGTYGSWEDNNTITGTIKNNILTGTFSENGDKGEFTFTLKEDETLTGKYRYTGDVAWSKWDCAKVSDDFGTAKTVWGGVWNTDLGAMVLEQKGNSVDGIYQSEGFLIRGTLSGQKFSGIFNEEQESGEFLFTLNEDGKTFTGKYWYDGKEEWNSMEGIKLNE
jgi:hypothetical protein